MLFLGKILLFWTVVVKVNLGQGFHKVLIGKLRWVILQSFSKESEEQQSSQPS